MKGRAERGIGLALFALVAVACSRPGDEQRIRDEIESMRAAAQSHRAADVLRYVADDFSAGDDNTARDAFARWLRLEMLTRDEIRAGVSDIEVTIDGDRATVRFDLHLGGLSRWLPAGGEEYRVISGWRRDGRDWLCYRASWTPAGA